MKNSRRNFMWSSLAVSTLSLTRWGWAAGVNGSGIPGSPEMIELGEKWKALNASDAKQRGREIDEPKRKDRHEP